jgi:hypothetical protein
VTFDSGAVRTIYPEWWGAKSDSTGDNGSAIQKAINACPNGGEVYLSGTSKGYLVSTGRLRFPGNKTIHLRGNGTNIYFSGSDTLFIVGSGTGTSAPRQKISGLRMAKVGTRGQGYAIVCNNTVFQTIEDCQIEFFKYAIELSNTGSSGYTEATTIKKVKVVSCNRGLRFNKIGSLASFKSTNVEDFTVTGTGATVGVDTVYGIYISTGANVYASRLNANIYLKDTTVAVYCNGQLQNTTGSLTIEVTGTASEPKTKAFWFGPNATNISCFIVADFTGADTLGVSYIGEIMKTETTHPVQGIFTQIHGVGNAKNRGISFIRNSSADLTRIASVTERDLATHDFVFDVKSDSTMMIRARRKHPIQLIDIENGHLMPFTGMWVGKRKTVTNTDSTEDVRDVSYLRLNKSSPVTLVNFTNPTANQLLFVLHVNANTKIKHSSLIKLHENLNFVPVGNAFQTFIYDSLGSKWLEIAPPSLPATTSESTSGSTPNVAWISYLRLNYSSPTTITDFANGRKGQILTVRHVTSNATIQHGEEITLQGSADFAGSANATQQFIYDEVAELWLEISRITP